MFTIVMCLVLLICSLKFYVMGINGRRYILLYTLMSMMSPPPAMCNLLVRTVVKHVRWMVLL